MWSLKDQDSDFPEKRESNPDNLVHKASEKGSSTGHVTASMGTMAALTDALTPSGCASLNAPLQSLDWNKMNIQRSQEYIKVIQRRGWRTLSPAEIQYAVGPKLLHDRVIIDVRPHA